MKHLFCLLMFLSTAVISAIPPQQSGFPFNVPNSFLVRTSPTNVADLDGDEFPEIIVGDAHGSVHAIKNNGSLYWQYDTGSAAIESKVVVADLNLDGNPEVIVSAGSTHTPSGIGSVTVLNGQTGAEICRYTPPQFGSDPIGVYGSVAVANLDKSDVELEIAFGDFGATVNVLNHDCSILWRSQQPPAVTQIQLPPNYDETMPPFTVYVNDTVGSSPAIADINNDGQLDVIIGVSSHVDDNNLTIDGGRLLVINGHNGSLIFHVDTDEAITSSPTIVDLDNDGSLDIIVGTGYCWQYEPCSPGNGTHNDGNQLYAWDSNGNNLPGWPFQLQNIQGNNYAITDNSPSVVDIDGDGFLEVFINAFLPIGNGPAFDGIVLAIEHNGDLKWSTIPQVPINQTDFIHPASRVTSPIIGDIDNDGQLDVVVPANFEPIVYHGTSGLQISTSSPNVGANDLSMRTSFTISSTLSLADIDKDGDFELISAGSDPNASHPTTFNIWDLDTLVGGETKETSYRNNQHNTGVYVIDDVFKNGFE